MSSTYAPTQSARVIVVSAITIQGGATATGRVRRRVREPGADTGEGVMRASRRTRRGAGARAAGWNGGRRQAQGSKARRTSTELPLHVLRCSEAWRASEGTTEPGLAVPELAVGGNPQLWCRT